MAALPTAVGIILGAILVFAFHHLSGFAAHARKHDREVDKFWRRMGDRKEG